MVVRPLCAAEDPPMKPEQQDMRGAVGAHSMSNSTATQVRDTCVQGYDSLLLPRTATTLDKGEDKTFTMSESYMCNSSLMKYALMTRGLCAP